MYDSCGLAWLTRRSFRLPVFPALWALFFGHLPCRILFNSYCLSCACEFFSALRAKLGSPCSRCVRESLIIMLIILLPVLNCCHFGMPRDRDFAPIWVWKVVFRKFALHGHVCTCFGVLGQSNVGNRSTFYIFLSFLEPYLLGFFTGLLRDWRGGNSVCSMLTSSLWQFCCVPKYFVEQFDLDRYLVVTCDVECS